MLKSVFLIIFMSSAYAIGFIIRQIAKDEFEWFEKRISQNVGRLKYIIAALGGLSIGPTPNPTIAIIIYGVLIIYSALVIAKLNKIASLRIIFKQSGIFILFGVAGLLIG